MSRPWRVGLTLSVVYSVLGITASLASACLEPQLYVSPSTAEAGDPVSFTITGTELDATYTVTVEGISVAGGTDTDQSEGTSGSFAMPNLGPQSRTVYARMVTQHDGSTWPDEVALQYQVPASSPPPPAGEESPPEQPIQQGAGSGPTQQVEEPPPDGGGDHSGPKQPGDDPGAARRTPATSSPGGGAEVANSPGAVVATQGRAEIERSTIAERAAGEHRASDEDESVAVPDRVLDAITGALGGDTRVGPTAIPSMLVVTLALLLGMGLGGLGMLILIGRKLGPDADNVAAEVAEGYKEAEIEAELQEIIAEERARQLLTPESDRVNPAA
jgi:hypothetical protein